VRKCLLFESQGNHVNVAVLFIDAVLGSLLGIDRHVLLYTRQVFSIEYTLCFSTSPPVEPNSHSCPCMAGDVQKRDQKMLEGNS